MKKTKANHKHVPDTLRLLTRIHFPTGGARILQQPKAGQNTTDSALNNVSRLNPKEKVHRTIHIHP